MFGVLSEGVSGGVPGQPTGGRLGVPGMGRLVVAGVLVGGVLNVGGPNRVVGASTINSCSGGDLLSHTLPGAVPSALWVLASGFGMGPGVSPTL